MLLAYVRPVGRYGLMRQFFVERSKFGFSFSEQCVE